MLVIQIFNFSIALTDNLDKQFRQNRFKVIKMIINQYEKNLFAKRLTSSGMSYTSDLSDRNSLLPGLSV